MTGAILLSEAPIVIASRPILTSQEEGPIRGTLLMGRYLDDAEVQRLSQTTHIDITIHSAAAAALPPDFQAAQAHLTRQNPTFIQPLNATTIAGYALIVDIYEQPALILRVTMPRDIYHMGQDSLAYFAGVLIIVGIATGAVVMFLLDSQVLRRLKRFSVAVRDIGVREDFAARLVLTGRDELACLAGAINAMLTALEQAQVKHKQAMRELRASEERLRMVFDSAMDGLFVIDAQARYVDVNRAGCQMFGYTRAEILRVDVTLLLFPEDVEQTLTDFQVEAPEGIFVPECRMRKKNGAEIWVEMTVAPFAVGEENLILGVKRDITERKWAEEALLRHNRDLVVLNAIAAAISQSLNLDYIIENTLDKILEMTRMDAGWIRLIDESQTRRMTLPLVQRGFAEEQEHIVEQCEIVNDEVVRLEHSLVVFDITKDRRFAQVCTEQGHLRAFIGIPIRSKDRVLGGLGVFSADARRVEDREIELLNAICHQIGVGVENALLFAAVKEQREQLRAMSARIAEAEEAERRRLARELHDQVGQNLSVLGISLNVIRTQLSPENIQAMIARLSDAVILLEQTTERIRGVMSDLRPTVLDDYGLMATLRGYGKRFAARTGISLEVVGEPFAPRLPAAIENILFRITQEALTNVAKHAQATEVTVQVGIEGNTVRLIVSDNGVGFDTAQIVKTDAQRGWGIISMTERAEAVGGHCRVEARPGQGTRVIVEVER